VTMGGRIGRRGRTGRARHLLAGALVLGLTGGLVSACSAVRNALGTTNGSCFVALPAANAAVGGHGKLIGVRLLAVSDLKSLSPKLYQAAVDAPGPRVTRVCLVAFRGRFSASGVHHPIGHPTGRLAVVEIEYPDKRLLATLLIRRLPLSFGHNHIGLF
jgi:hypothetical protein